MMLDVYLHTRLVGHLTDTGRGLTFRYAVDWLEHSECFPISQSLPLSADEQDEGLSTGWFWNLLPEDDQLRVFASRLGLHPGEIFALLRRMGRETAGALCIGGPEHPGRYFLRSPAELAEDIAGLPARPLHAGEDEVTLSLAGAQSKMAVALFDDRIHLPQNGAASTHILKPDSQRLYASVENEALCMRLAKAVGVDTPNVQLGIAEGYRYLLIERYDRKRREDGFVDRLHQEDSAQALGIPPTRKYEASGGPGLSALFALIDAASTQLVEDRLALLDRVIFNAAVGNTDAHAKNFSFMISPDGHRLAPLYDVLSAGMYDGITENLAMKIGSARSRRYVFKEDWQEFANQAGLGPAATLRQVDRLCRKILEHLPATADELIQDPAARPDAVRLFSSAIQEQTERTLRNAQLGRS